MKRILVISFFSLWSIFSIAQTPKLDSLWKVWHDTAQSDSNKFSAIYDITKNYIFSQPDSAYHFAQMLYDFAKTKGAKKRMADALNMQGISFDIRAEHSRAIELYNKSLEIQKEIGDKVGIANSLNNIGLIYESQGNYRKAIDYMHRSFKIREELKDDFNIGNSLNNIGNIYYIQENYSKALEYYNRSLVIREKLKDKRSIAGSLNNIGIIYKNQGDFEKAIELYNRSIKIDKEIGNVQGTANTLSNLGNIYSRQGQYDSAIAYHTKSMEIKERAGDKQGIISSMTGIGNVCFQQKKYSKAISYVEKSLSMAQEIGLSIEIREAARVLYDSYKAIGNHSKALNFYELYNTMNDSVLSEENKMEIIHQEYKHEYDREHFADSLAFIKQHELDELAYQAELEKEANQRYALYGGIAFLLLLGGVVYRGYQQKKKDNAIISRQKDRVELQKQKLEKKNKEILDSIIYAKRIQKAILPPDKLMKEHLKDCFILYKPKDIVAGDFYWMASKGDNVLFAAADCTGHGVPGAMVSVVCNNGLNRSVREFGLTDPGQILNKTRELVIQEFEKAEEDVKDGMDIALCSLTLHTSGGGVLQYAGANNPLWIIRDGELIETKADKQPIGKFIKPFPYTTHRFDLQKGDTIYLFSDGYADQFGGDRNKKFMTANMRKLFLSMQKETMDKQNKLIEETFDKWRGRQIQVDDVCIIGVRV